MRGGIERSNSPSASPGDLFGSVTRNPKANPRPIPHRTAVSSLEALGWEGGSSKRVDLFPPFLGLGLLALPPRGDGLHRPLAPARGRSF